MVRLEQICFPKKSLGFFSYIPFFGENYKIRKTIIQQLLSRKPYKEEIDCMWYSLDFLPHAEIPKILECIRLNNGWPNSFFLPSDSFIALAPLDGNYGSISADYDTVNNIFFILHPEEKKQMKSSKQVGDLLTFLSVLCGDIPIFNVEQFLPDTTINNALQMMIRGIARP